MTLKRYARWLALCGLALLLFAAVALAASNKLHVSAPKSVKLGSSYTVTVSGNASGNANFVVGWERANVKCKKNYDKEYHFLGNPTSASISMPVSGHFSQGLTFTAQHKGKGYLCAYLINQTTTHTYKHATAHWKEHK